MNLGSERRNAQRSWATAGTEGMFTDGAEHRVLGPIRILDVSENGCLAFGLLGNFPIGITGNLIISRQDTTQQVEYAEVARTEGMYIAFKFNPTINVRKFFHQKKDSWDFATTTDPPRITLATKDIEDLSAQVRYVKDCQIRVLLNCVSLSVGLASLLAVLYQLNAQPGLRILVSLGPAFVVAICAWIGLFKGATLNRAESFLLLLKQQVSQGSLPIGYYGWEDALSRLTNGPRLGRDYAAEGRNHAAAIGAAVKLKSQSPLLAGVTACTYVLIYLVSIVGAYLQVRELHEGYRDVTVAVLSTLGALITALALAAAWEVRSGRWSAIAFLYAWAEILGDPAPFHPNSLLPKRHER